MGDNVKSPFLAIIASAQELGMVQNGPLYLSLPEMPLRPIPAVSE